MAYASMPQFVSIHGPKIGCNELSMSTITDVLQSESVKRLFQRQNVYVQNPVASGSKSSDFTSDKNCKRGRSNGTIDDSKSNKEPELSVIPIMNLQENLSEVSGIEDKHLLPSKYAGKSEVALVPIRRERRRCGHYEPCENIVCDVVFQQYADKDSVCPLIAVNIDANEIDAPVTKHCKSDDCDALSIDHDRCRKAIIRCHRCDVSNICDICLVSLKTRKSQMNHKNCKMRIEYRHNRTSRGQILKDRMRQREMQILEAARVNKNDYSDPITGHDRAMESLQNNSELIIIPKASLPLQQHRTIKITSITGAATKSNVQNTEMYRFLPRFPFVFPQQKMLLGKRAATENFEHVSPEKQSKIIGSSGSTNFPSVSGKNSLNSFITVAKMPNKHFVKPVNITNLLQSSTQANSASTMQSNPFLMPIRVVPITGLKTMPSFKHQMQGIPKYCIVAENTTQSSPIYAKAPSMMLSARKTSRIKSESNVRRDSRKSDLRTEQLLKKFKTGMRRGRRRQKTGPKKSIKSFECTFCFKRFSTDWYFKLHIAKHKGEIKFTCKYCKKPFMHLYNMTKHVVTMHKKEAAGESLTEEDIEENIDENEQSLNCINCKLSFESKTEMENHPCRIICLRCNARILDGDLMLHLKVKHVMSDEKAVEEYERQKRQSIVAGRNRVKTKKELEAGETRRARIKEDSEIATVQRENGVSKRKRHSIILNEGQNVRRLTRRRNNSRTDQIQTILPNKTDVVDEEKTLNTNTDVSRENQTSQESATILPSFENAATTDLVNR